VVDSGCSLKESKEGSVIDDSRVTFRETAVDVELEEASVTYGFGYMAKFLNDASDVRGAFQGKRRITIQLKLKRRRRRHTKR